MALSRRGFILTGIAAGGGLGVVYGARSLDDGDAVAKFGAAAPGETPLNAFLRIAPDGAVTCAVHRAEMGQGVTTTLPALLAEELDGDWEKIRFEFAPVDRDYFNFGILLRGRPLGDTEGRFWAAAGTGLIRRVFHVMGLSMTISSSSAIDAWDTLRPAAAAARAMLVEAAARRWGVAARELRTEAGFVIGPAGRLSYGELAAEAAELRPPDDVPVKDPGEWRLVGRSLPRLDVPDKARGATRYSLDTRLPGMLHAAIRHAPVSGARVAAFDATAAEAMPGVRKVVAAGDDALAVIATDTWSAMRAAARIELRSEGGAQGLETAQQFDAYKKIIDAPEPTVFRDDGEAGAVIGSAASVHEAYYRVPYLAHVCMEPMNCTALVDDGGVTVWAPSQAHSIARDVAAEAAGVDKDRVRVHTTFMGGGFGRRAEMDFVRQAVLVAAAVPGTPVQLAWSREEDVRHDMYRPAGMCRIRGGLDLDGRIAALDYTLVTSSVTASYNARTPNPRGGDAKTDGTVASGASNLLYPVPALRVAYHAADPGVPVGFWRSTGSSYNVFFIESFIDELAALAGADPVAFRLAQLPEDGKHARVLRRAAELSGWAEAPGNGRGRGVALAESHGSIAATVAEVAVAGDDFSVTRLYSVLDCRTVLHPDIVVAQMESALVDGYASALHGEVRFAGGEAVPGNFDTYRWPRLADVPELAVELMPLGGRPGGVGEPGVPGVAPAIANALYAATGERRRALPLVEQYRA